jgi:3-methylcrotonyl-CoA carboxylase alpha subunit
MLVANRGEISVRVQRSARELGLRTVAVFVDADRGAPHATLADEAVLVASYLDSDELIRAARVTGARSVHPGYGFLSENADFARAVDRAGIAWIGPPAAAIELMGDKARSKQLAVESGVPVVPGTEGAGASAEQIRALAAEHGYPLMIKALAGGGGKGMRVVAADHELDAALAAARREAEAAFGDGRLLAERYLERPRHIEIQVLADSHGNAVHLGERECSLQRRHQKVVEEAPSPVVDARLREEMGSAAVALAIACDYEGAGTVEFIVPASGERFFFLEMNTRLQVEHPVTEMVWGVDLVGQQLRLAAGERLDAGLSASGPLGHAVEARLYAEDPAAGFLPSTGVIRRWREPVGAGIRIDSGVAEGSVVGTEFDPMLAKLVAHGPDRATALGRLDRALAELELLGVTSSAAFTRALLADPEVSAGRLDTTLLERLLGELDLNVPDDLIAAGALGLHLADTEGLGIGAGPWRRRFARIGEIRIGDGEIGGAVRFTRAEARRLDDGSLLCELDGLARTYAATLDGGTIWIARDGHQLRMAPEQRKRAAPVAAGSLEAPMPGVVLIVEVANGDRVEQGQVLLVLESMKMELQVTAPVAGVVEGLELGVGDRVAQGEALAVIGTDPEAGPSDETEEG